MWCLLFSGRDKLLDGQFWAMGRLNLLDEQINFPGWAYLPEFNHTYQPNDQTGSTELKLRFMD